MILYPYINVPQTEQLHNTDDLSVWLEHKCSCQKLMSTTSPKKEVYKSEIKERSEEELLEEKIRNQQTIDIFIESDKNWC